MRAASGGLVAQELRRLQRAAATALGWAGRLRLMRDSTEADQNLVARLLARREFIVARRESPLVQFPPPPPSSLSEAAFQHLLVELLEAAGFMVHHETDSRRTAHGYPDLWAVRPPRLLAIELKSAQGAPSLPQLWWMDDLARCAGARFEYHLWTPGAGDWPKILRALAPDTSEGGADGANDTDSGGVAA